MITNFDKDQNIAGIYGDIFGDFTSGILLKNNELAVNTNPFRTANSSYTNYVGIGIVELLNSDTSLVDNLNKNNYYIQIRGENKLTRGVIINVVFKFKCRFFNNETMIIKYDFKTKEKFVELE